jgi:hypothetical protein
MNRNILDIGGGPCSLLLKTFNYRYATVVDPCDYPAWVQARYQQCNINYFQHQAETFDLRDIKYDEVWMYNVLQHVEDPEKIMLTAKKAANRIRLFEWIDSPIEPGHPNTFDYNWFSKYLWNISASVETFNGNPPGLHGKAIYGEFMFK